MQIDLAFSPRWTREDLGRVRVYTAPDYTVAPDVVFEVFPVFSRTEIEPRDVLLHDVAPELELRSERPESAATANGWPITLQAITLHEPGGAFRELRLLAHYQVLVVQAFVLVRSVSVERFQAHRAQILELITTAKIDLTDDRPAAISELWSM